MAIQLLNDRLQVTIYHDWSANSVAESICLYFEEACQGIKKIFQEEEINLRISPAQALTLVSALLEAVKESERHHPHLREGHPHHGEGLPPTPSEEVS